LLLDDSTLEKPYSPFNALLYRHWLGKQQAVVEGINLIILLSSDRARCVPVGYRVIDKDRDGKTKNEHFSEKLLCWKLINADLIPNWCVSTVGMPG
jgi:hypothetical protein